MDSNKYNELSVFLNMVKTLDEKLLSLKVGYDYLYYLQPLL